MVAYLLLTFLLLPDESTPMPGQLTVAHACAGSSKSHRVPARQLARAYHI
ncbi:MAG: hypothetical protein J6Y80_03755 [Victivallales bacterium]|nr:hypothetical protein [Victivallales bacterium]